MSIDRKVIVTFSLCKRVCRPDVVTPSPRAGVVPAKERKSRAESNAAATNFETAPKTPRPSALHEQHATYTRAGVTRIRHSRISFMLLIAGSLLSAHAQDWTGSFTIHDNAVPIHLSLSATALHLSCTVRG